MSPVRAALACIVSFTVLGCASTPKRVAQPVPQFALTEGSRNEAASVRVNVTGHGHGSGTIIRLHDGCFILTSEHVVRDAADPMVSVTVQNADGTDETRPAEVLHKDPARDLAVVWTRRCGRGYRAELASDDEAAAGTFVYSIGFPGDAIRQSTRGRVRKNPFFVHMRPAEPADFDGGILVDMASEAGSSGAGVFSAASGRLVGVHKMSFGEDGDARSVIVSVKEVRRLLEEYGLDLE